MSYLFIATHFGAGGNILLNAMSKNSRIRGINFSGFVYHAPPDLTVLRNHLNRYDRPKPGTIYIDKLVYNTQITSKHFYDKVKWIYLIREPEETLKYLVSKHNYTPANAEKYYSFRLRRLCEMASHTPDSLVIHFEDLWSASTLQCIEKYLNLKEKISLSLVGEIHHEEVEIPDEVYYKAKWSWNKYTKYLRTVFPNYRACPGQFLFQAVSASSIQQLAC